MRLFVSKQKTICALAALLFVGCWGSRYVSADADLESIFMGRSYYDIVDQFGHPDIISQDDEGGTRIAYNFTTLVGTSAAPLYKQYDIRNRRTKQTGNPGGSITFSFNARMKCYAVASDFQREKKPKTATKPNNATKQEFFAKPRVPRTHDFPYVESYSPFGKVVSIERIEVEANQTKVYFSFDARTPEHRPLYDKGLAINPDVFIRDNTTGKHIKLIKAEGITLYPEYTTFAHNRGGFDVLNYTLIFEALPLDVQTIDIVEPGPEGFNFYGVDVRSPMTFRESKQANPIE